MGPEVVLGLPYNEAVDMWAAGAVFFMLFTKKLPFEHSTLDDAYPEVSHHTSCCCRIMFDALVFSFPLSLSLPC